MIEKLKNTIHKNKYKTVLVSSITVISTMMVVAIGKPSVELSVFDGSLIWKSSGVAPNKEYHLYRNGEKILTSKQKKYRDSSVGDKSAPESVSDIRATSKDGVVSLDWEDVNDNGTVSSYIVSLLSDGDEVAHSNEVYCENTSGLQGYRVEFNGDVEDIEDSNYLINTSTLQEGEYCVRISAVDEAGNISKAVEKRFKVYKPHIKDNRIILDSDVEFNFSVNVGGESLGVDKENRINTESLKDITPPTGIEKVSTLGLGSRTNLFWSSSKDSGTIYTAEVTGSTNSGDNISSLVQLESNVSRVRGYYYAVTNSSDYVVTEEDSFTRMPTLFMVNLPYDINYFHLIAVDNEGNKSVQYTQKL